MPGLGEEELNLASFARIDPLYFSQGKRSNTSFFYRTGVVNKNCRYDHSAINRKSIRI